MKTGGKNRKQKLLTAGALILLIVCAVVLTLVAEKMEDQFGLRKDLTGSQIFSIGDKTKEVLAGLDEDIRIYTVYESGEEDRTITELLRRYAQESSHITIENVDPVENPFFTEKYSTDGQEAAKSSIIIQSEEDADEYYVIAPENLYEWNLKEDQLYATGMVAEQRITSAIALIENGMQTTACFVTGHGGMSVTEQYYLANTLESDGYKIEEYDLVYNDRELEKKDCLLFLGPTSDLSDEEFEIVSTFMENGGKALFLISPLAGDLPNFNKLFESFGLQLQDDLIIETDADYYLNSQLMLRPELNGENPVNASVVEAGASVVLPRCRSITVGESSGIETSPVFTSSGDSYGKTNPETATIEKEEGDTDGPFVLGVTAENTKTNAKIVLIGCTDFVSTLDNARFEGNIAAFMDSTAWASEKPDSVVISPKSLVSAPLQIGSTAASYRLMILVILIVPAILLICGFFVWRGRSRL